MRDHPPIRPCVRGMNLQVTWPRRSTPKRRTGHLELQALAWRRKRAGGRHGVGVLVLGERLGRL